jgi:hypothetical protein
MYPQLSSPQQDQVVAALKELLVPVASAV